MVKGDKIKFFLPALLLGMVCVAIGLLFRESDLFIVITSAFVFLSFFFYAQYVWYKTRKELNVLKLLKEEAVRTAEDIFSSTFNSSTDSMFLMDTEQNIIDCNKSALISFEVESKDQLKGKYIIDLFKDKTRSITDMGRVRSKLESGDVWALETEFVTHKDKHFWGSFTAKRIKVGGNYLDLLGISNLTKLKDTEASLEQQNNILKAEKKKLIKANDNITMLLKEVHHRVKNNLQVVTSMLRLQSSFIEDTYLKNVFRGSVSRIMTMSIIHEKLYQSEVLLGINVEEYFEELVSNILNTYQYRTNVKSSIEVGKVDFALDEMVPLGLLLNELITNSLKHAFENSDTQGKIEVKIFGDAEYTLVYADNGMGLPKGYSINEEKTFGSTMILSLIDQLEGKLEVVEKEAGMCYKVHFNQVAKEKGYKENMEVHIEGN